MCVRAVWRGGDGRTKRAAPPHPRPGKLASIPSGQTVSDEQQSLGALSPREGCAAAAAHAGPRLGEGCWARDERAAVRPRQLLPQQGGSDCLCSSLLAPARRRRGRAPRAGVPVPPRGLLRERVRHAQRHPAAGAGLSSLFADVNPAATALYDSAPRSRHPSSRGGGSAAAQRHLSRPRTAPAAPPQGVLTPSSRGFLRFDQAALGHGNASHALEGLAGYSHCWLLFHFHANRPARLLMKVQPPRLGGEKARCWLRRRQDRFAAPAPPLRALACVACAPCTRGALAPPLRRTRA